MRPTRTSLWKPLLQRSAPWDLGEAAHSRLSRLDGNATYRNYIIDAIYNMTPEQLEEGARYEMR